MLRYQDTMGIITGGTGHGTGLGQKFFGKHNGKCRLLSKICLMNEQTNERKVTPLQLCKNNQAGAELYQAQLSLS